MFLWFIEPKSYLYYSGYTYLADNRRVAGGLSSHAKLQAFGERLKWHQKVIYTFFSIKKKVVSVRKD